MTIENVYNRALRCGAAAAAALEAARIYTVQSPRREKEKPRESVTEGERGVFRARARATCLLDTRRKESESREEILILTSTFLSCMARV